MSLRYTCAEASVRARGLTRATQVLADRRLVVLPTDSVYGLAADAFSPEAVALLHATRGQDASRAAAPPVFVPRPRTLDGLATAVSAAARALAETFWPGPLSLLCLPQPTLDWGLTGARTVLLRMPLHPVALELLARTGPLAVTAASPPGRPAPVTLDEAMEHFADGVMVYLDAGTLAGGLASTVVDATGSLPRVLREGALSLADLRRVVPDIGGPAGHGGTE